MHLNRTSILGDGGLPVNCHLTKNDVRKGKRGSFEGAEFMVKSQNDPGLWYTSHVYSHIMKKVGAVSV
jgi:hypothetical protein